MRKSIEKFLLAFLCVFSFQIIPESHIHDDECGYQQDTREGCIFEISFFEGKDWGN